MCDKFVQEASELLDDEEISIKIEALVSYFNVIYAKSLDSKCQKNEKNYKDPMIPLAKNFGKNFT